MSNNPTLITAKPRGETPLAELLHHHLWANLRLLDTCATLDPEQLEASAPGTYGTIRATLEHLVNAEQGYLMRLTGRQPERRFKAGDNPSIAELSEQARQSGEALLALAGEMRSTDIVEAEWEGQRWQFPASVMLVQAINHAAEHRTNVTTILAQLGINFPAEDFIDGWAYLMTLVEDGD
jgi:uncharacterized damage-inducible protein DinB